MANWEGVSECVAVAQSGSFTQAAKSLRTSVVQVSRRIAALEQRLGVKLFNRTTRKVSLTEAGVIYYQKCQYLVQGLEQAELAVTQMQSLPQGLLRVTAPVTFGEKRIAPLVIEFLARYPLVDIDLNLTNQPLDLIESGLDIAIRLGHLKDSGLIARRLGSRQLYVCASPDYINQYGEPRTPAELSSHQCLVGSVDHWHFRDQQRAKSLRVSGRMRCNSGISLQLAASQGLGLVQLPDYYVAPMLASGELVEVLKPYRDEREGIWALCPPGHNLSPKVRLFIDYLAEKLNTARL